MKLTRAQVIARAKRKHFKKKWGHDPRSRLWQCSLSSSKLRDLEHTIKFKDIPMPDTCVFLGCDLIYSDAKTRRGKKPYNLATIDRIDSNLGYIPGNIQVISLLANKMKSDATEEQLIKFARGVLKHYKK